ncbi:unnamed protein product [Miscanthus lutarioriparius]|uniref:Uncharacterized protein n=1 Tax=Miscanthus lutarioriparius TaxID=422564 RepID=A0A811SKG9_9POAL|nr:unnamed protein product [Miscanthus lutarioriparius]
MDPASGKIEGYGTKLQRDLEGKKTWNDFFFFHVVAPPEKVDHAVWPESLAVAGYREANEEYCSHMQRLTRELFEHLSLGLGLHEGAMAAAFGGDGLPELTLGVAPHTDMSTLTVLVPNDAGPPSLQGWSVVRRQIFSKAVLHRTTVNKEKMRMSWPVFVELPGELVLGPHPN